MTSETARFRWSRPATLALGVCTAWLVIENVMLFTLLAWAPLAPLRVALAAMVRVMVHAVPAHGLLVGSGVGLALALPPAALGLARGLGVAGARHD